MQAFAYNDNSSVRRSGRDRVLNQAAEILMQGQTVGITGHGCALSVMKYLPLLNVQDIYVFGVHIGSGREHCLGKAGSLIEYPALFADCSLRENIRMFGAFLKKFTPERQTELIEALRLRHYENRRLKDLPAEEAMKVQLLIALLKGPTLLVLDEPEALFPSLGGEDLKQLIAAIRKTSAVIVMSERRESAAALSDNCFLFERGRLRSL